MYLPDCELLKKEIKPWLTLASQEAQWLASIFLFCFVRLNCPNSSVKEQWKRKILLGSAPQTSLVELLPKVKKPKAGAELSSNSPVAG